MLPINGVSTIPGDIVLNRSFFLAYVFAADLVRPSTPALAEAISSWFDKPMLAAAVDIRTIELFSSSAPAARTTENELLRFVFIVYSNSSSVHLWAGFNIKLPGRQTIASTVPNFSRPFSTNS